MRIDVAPASRQFSSSSFNAEAGLCMIFLMSELSQFWWIRCTDAPLLRLCDWWVTREAFVWAKDPVGVVHRRGLAHSCYCDGSSSRFIAKTRRLSLNAFNESSRAIWIITCDLGPHPPSRWYQTSTGEQSSRYAQSQRYFLTLKPSGSPTTASVHTPSWRIHLACNRTCVRARFLSHTVIVSHSPHIDRLTIVSQGAR